MPQVQAVGDQPDEHDRLRREQSSGPRRSAAAAEDHRRRRHAGRRRPQAGERRELRQEPAARQRPQQPAGGQRLPHRPRQPFAPADDRQQRPHAHLPRPAGEQVECEQRVVVPHGVLRESQGRGDPDRRDRRQSPPTEPPVQPGPPPPDQRQRDDEVELLLDRQAPTMKQRHELGGLRKVAGRSGQIEPDVRRHRLLPQRGGAEVREVRREQHRRPDRQRDERHHSRRGHDPANPPHPEPAQREPGPVRPDAARPGPVRTCPVPRVLSLQDEGGDEVAADHEEQIDPDVSPPEPQPGVIQHDHPHRDRPQAVDIRTISERRGRTGHAAGRNLRAGAGSGRRRLGRRRYRAIGSRSSPYRSMPNASTTANTSRICRAFSVFRHRPS